MRAGYFTEQEELIEDLEKYEDKVDQFYEGLQLMQDEPMKAFMMMGDAFGTFRNSVKSTTKTGRMTVVSIQGTLKITLVKTGLEEISTTLTVILEAGIDPIVRREVPRKIRMKGVPSHGTALTPV
ncbi:MAG: hypothetical protein V5A79_01200 [Candidatus Bipolaricaulota bacterium]